MAKTNDVTFQRGEYQSCLYAWDTVDAVMSQQAIKEAETKFLPMPMPKDTSEANKARYRQYLARAVLWGATERTLSSLVGAAFQKVPTLTVPSAIDYVGSDIDGSGLSIYQQSQLVLSDVMKRARHALLVDYPQTQRPASQADLRSGRIRATVASISARRVVNWRTRRVGAEYKLDLVVIFEDHEEETEDGFGVETIPQYRVLRLTDEGYTQEVWRKREDKDEWFLFTQPFFILDGKGSKWDEIPLTFVGSVNNDPSPDKSPMLSMAEKEIAHYQVGADCRHSAYMTGQAQPVITGLTEKWRDHMEKQGIYFGSNAPLLLPENATADLLQTQGNTQAEREREYIEKMINSLGARLVQPGGAVKTATEAQDDNEQEHSVLSLAVSNVSEAYVKCLEWIKRFMNVEGDAIYEINQDYTRKQLDPQMLTAAALWWDKGQWPLSDMRNWQRKTGLVDPEKTDEQIDEELSANPPGLNLGDA
ncbi:DUF4055 domain-containing protein [Pseudohongiella sp. O18]|uniref:DUF4055 domain-containing protein n=1 Tax=Pseudohongiella sp. O18 TaxID=2904248 RepID=UPI001F16C2F7|nr:DUF4055 domain-containing protein [Pseudohongiella sp. O18]